MPREDFVAKAMKRHGGKYDYSRVSYINCKEKVEIICPVHGSFWQTPDAHLRQGCRLCGIEKRAAARKSSTAEFIEEARKVHGDSFDYSLAEYESCEKKVRIICRKCGRIFSQRPQNHLAGYGCIYCGGRHRPDTAEFIEKAREIHGDKYDYSKMSYTDCRTKIRIICPDHGEFWQTPDCHVQGRGCPCCKESRGERQIRTFLESRGYRKDVDFVQECIFPDLADERPLRYDFYIRPLNCVIEYNGPQHYRKCTLFGDTREKFLLRKHHDWLKRKYAEAHGIKYVSVSFRDNIAERLSRLA